MIVTFDTETTTFQKGNPFARRNRLCYLGYSIDGRDIHVGGDTFFLDARPHFDAATRLVGFNAKFDLHWLRRQYEWRLGQDGRIWDCQLADFLLGNQRNAFPSLDSVATKYGLKRELKRSVALWNSGVDTPDIPKEIIQLDLSEDVRITYEIYVRQLDEFQKRSALERLFHLNCQDLVVLADMEFNGLNYNEQLSREKADAIRNEIVQLENQLQTACSVVKVNWDSPEHISAFLYGGTIREDRKELCGFYKGGLKAGQPKLRNVTVEYHLPRLVEPLERSKLKKEGLWSSDESILRQLKGNKDVTEALIKRSKLQKELDYFEGLPMRIEEYNWPEGEIHGQFNQCVVSTGRLSSSGPNQQNLPPSVKQLIESHYE